MPAIRMVTAQEVTDRMHDYARLFAHVFGQPPWNEAWRVLPEEGGTIDNNAWFYIDALLQQASDVFAAFAEESEELLGFGVGVRLCAAKIEQLGFGKYGAQPDHYCSAVVAVNPNAHRCGIGKQLITARIDRARELGCTEIWVRVLQGHDPINMPYQRLGFQVAGEQQIEEGGIVSVRTVYRFRFD